MAHIDTTHPGKVVAYEGEANASYYIESRRVIVVADSGCFADVLAAVTALRDEVC